MASNENSFVGFGNDSEWKAFEEIHKVFIDKVPLIYKTFSKVFTRKFDASSPRVNKIIFQLGAMCVEDFKEILLLCANGYGIGGQKLLRGMYEKAVTAEYLSLHPDTAEDFWNYYYVHMRKTSNQAKKYFGETFLSDVETAEIEEEYNRVKERFEETACKKCGTKKPQMSWTKNSIEAMISKDSLLKELYYDCYFLPTLQFHTTVPSILNRLEPIEEPMGAYFSSNSQKEEVKTTLRNTHLLMLSVLILQNEHSNLGLTDELSERGFDFEETWANKKNTDNELEK